MRLYRILQLDVFVFCPFTRTSSRPVDAGIQEILPSIITLHFRSTRNQRGNCGPILATVRLYRILQLANAVGAGLALGAPLGLGLVVTVESVGAAGGVASSVIVGCKFDGTKDAFTSCARQLSASGAIGAIRGETTAPCMFLGKTHSRLRANAGRKDAFGQKVGLGGECRCFTHIGGGLSTTR
jgi:hypothetical protein